jgi:hypothetical protein
MEHAWLTPNPEKWLPVLTDGNGEDEEQNQEVKRNPAQMEIFI